MKFTKKYVLIPFDKYERMCHIDKPPKSASDSSTTPLPSRDEQQGQGHSEPPPPPPPPGVPNTQIYRTLRKEAPPLKRRKKDIWKSQWETLM